VRSPFGAPPGQQPTDQFYDESPTVVLFVARSRRLLYSERRGHNSPLIFPPV